MGKSGKIQNRASVAVVDDDVNTRILLRDLMESSRSFRFDAGFATAREALIAIPRLQPQLTLMDIQLSDLSGIECTRRLKRIMPALEIIILTGAHDPEWATASFEAGAAACLIKPFGEDQLLATLSFAVATANRDRTHRVASNSRRELKPALSPRQTEVLSALAEGLLYKEISEKLGISYAAVHKHQHSIFNKLRVSNRSEAIRIWFEMRQR